MQRYFAGLGTVEPRSHPKVDHQIKPVGRLAEIGASQPQAG
jgi:hypothetical protein